MSPTLKNAARWAGLTFGVMGLVILIGAGLVSIQDAWLAWALYLTSGFSSALGAALYVKGSL